MIHSSKIISLLCLAAYFGTATPLHAQTALPSTSPLLRDKVALTKKSNPFLSAYLKLANDGDLRSQTILGTIYLQKDSDSYSPGDAYKWFHKAANGGSKLAQFNVGVLYQKGLGTSKNDKKALYWFNKVVDESNEDKSLTPEMLAWAQLKLGIIYHDGKGVPVDYNRALKWFNKLTIGNHAYGQYMVGYMHAYGHGVPKNINKAMAWFKAAAAQGLEAAQNELSTAQGRYNLTPVDLGTTTVNNDARATPDTVNKELIRINNDASMNRVKLGIHTKESSII
ncbi:MAG: sel1 repeat family protein [Magnetococcales bacterium]|nr:sel1 repeat family protein [Magnetococcales bacterium]